MTKVKKQLTILSTLLNLLLVSCGDSSSDIAQGCIDISNSKIVIGDTLDWKKRSEIGDELENQTFGSVGQLKLPKLYSSCTAFVVADGVIMTNNHCVGRLSDLDGAQFLLESDKDKIFECRDLVKTSYQLDYALVKCENLKGAVKPLSFAYEVAQTDSDVFVVQANCNYVDDPYCDVSNYYSSGIIRRKGSYSISHSADTLPGSSGSPMLLSHTDLVIALHNASSSGNAEPINYAVPIEKIIDDITRSKLGIDLKVVYDLESYLDEKVSLPSSPVNSSPVDVGAVGQEEGTEGLSPVPNC